MTGMLDDYIAARVEYDRAGAGLEEMRDRISTLASALENKPEKITVMNLPTPVPEQMTAKRDSIKVDSQDWPTAEKIQEILVRWHRSKAQVIETWGLIPADQRDIVKPPPWNQKA